MRECGGSLERGGVETEAVAVGEDNDDDAAAVDTAVEGGGGETFTEPSLPTFARFINLPCSSSSFFFFFFSSSSSSSSSSSPFFSDDTRFFRFPSHPLPFPVKEGPGPSGLHFIPASLVEYSAPTSTGGWEEEEEGFRRHLSTRTLYLKVDFDCRTFVTVAETFATASDDSQGQ